MTNDEKIAKFMGLPLTRQSVKFTGGTKEVPFRTWRYSTSWDELMSVVDKIETMFNPDDHRRGFVVTIDSQYCIISENGENMVVDCQSYDTRIENVYHAILKFIDWYDSVVTPLQQTPEF